ncbi:hypothetical protein GCM10023324_16240 [Streptomyces youssoufiensis]
MAGAAVGRASLSVGRGGASAAVRRGAESEVPRLRTPWPFVAFGRGFAPPRPADFADFPGRDPRARPGSCREPRSCRGSDSVLEPGSCLESGRPPGPGSFLRFGLLSGSAGWCVGPTAFG